MMIIENAFNIGDTVYLITCTDQLERIVTGLHVRKTSITYALSCGVNETNHYDFEITVDKNVLKTTSN